MKAKHFCRWLVVLVLLVSVSPAGACQIKQQRPAPLPEQPQDGGGTGRQVAVYPLKYTNASDAARVLQQVLAGSPGRPSVRVTADERTNSVLVEMALTDRPNVEKLLKEIDAPAKEQSPEFNQLFIVRLNHLVPDADVEKALQLVYQNRPGRYAVDRQRRMVILSGDRQFRDAAEALLKTMDEAQGRRQQGDELQVRLVWLATGLQEEKPQPIPADLNEVVLELGKLGIEKPRLVAQVLVNTPKGTPFQVAGSAHLGGPCRLTATGTLTDKVGGLGLEIDLSAFRSSAAANRGAPFHETAICQLRTTITTPIGHAVVMGVTPTEGMTSIFVIQVLNRGEPRKR
jgi:hypothetical protein